MATITFIDLNGRHFLPYLLTFLSGEPPERTIRRAVLGYRTAGLSARDLADDIPADAETGEGGLLHYAAFAKVSADFSDIEIDLAFAVDNHQHNTGSLHMNNYVILDSNIGFIQWVGKAATPLEAVNAFDEDTGWTANNEKPGLEEVEFPRGQRQPDELIVREAPTGWDCDDGQNQEKIDEADDFPIAGVFKNKDVE